MPHSLKIAEALFAHAQHLMPAGVSSPVRAFRKVGGTPRYFSKGEGAFAKDEDGNTLLDLCMAWGPLVLGHAHRAVIEAVVAAARDGLAFGTVHRNEIALAELVLEAFPEHGKVRFVVSGTEAVSTAMRLARAYTKRSMILKFSGCYHGHLDSLLVKAGSGVVTQGLADSLGVPESIASQTIVVPLDDDAALISAFEQYGSRIAAVILEPMPANNGLLPQRKAWLTALREHCTKHGALLVFDEVITGFRFHFGGYGRLVGVKPDLTTLGKIVGGGLPVAAVVGRQEIMDQLAPLGGVYQAGTMAGNPVTLAAGIATLKELRRPGVYESLEKLGAQLEAGWRQRANGLALQRQGSMFWPYFEKTQNAPTSAEAIRSEVIDRYHASYATWLGRGVYLPPSGYEVSFLSTAHTPANVETILDALLKP